MNKKVKDVIYYCLILIVTGIALFPYLKDGIISPDNYNIQYLGFYKYAITYNLKDGRPFICLFNLIFDKCQIFTMKPYTIICLILGLFLSAGICILIKNIISKYREPKNHWQSILIHLISFGIIFNYLYYNCLYFAEFVFMALSILLFICAADMLVNKDENIKATILALLGILSYQATISVFFVFVILFSILKNNMGEHPVDIKSIVMDTLKMIIISFVVVAIEFVLIKIVTTLLNLDQSRASFSIGTIGRNLKVIKNNLVDVYVKNCSCYPIAIPLVVCVTTVITYIIYNLKNGEKKSYIVEIIVLFFITLIAPLTLNVISTSSLDQGRTKLVIGMLYFILLMYIYIKSDMFNNQIILYTFIGATAIFVISILSVYHFEVYENIEGNKQEQSDLAIIKNYIENYEETYQTQVTNIFKIYYQKEEAYYYENGYNKISGDKIFQTTLRTWEFSDRLISIYMNRDFTAYAKRADDLNEIIEINMTGKTYMCKGNTLYIIVDIV